MSGCSGMFAGVLATAIILGGPGNAVLAAQRPGNDRPTARKTSVIEGTVLNAVTGMPLSKAHVMLRYADPGYGLRYRAETNASGGFVVVDVEPGNYWLQLEKKGFLEQASANGGSSDKFLSVGPGQHVRNILLRALPCGVVTGTVLTEDGEPVTGAEVQAMRRVQQRPGPQVQVVRSTRTNDLGQYRLYALAPGTYYVAAHYDAGEESWGDIKRTDGEFTESYATTFYAETTDPAGATPIPLAAGAEAREIDIALLKIQGRLVTSLTLSVPTEQDREAGQEDGSDSTLLQPIVPKKPQDSVIEGEVVNEVTAAPLRGVHLILRRAGAGPDIPYVVDSDAQGHFRMTKVETGQYRLWAAGKGLPEQEYAAAGPDGTGKVLTVMPGQHLHDVLFRATPPSVITGKVLDEDGEPISGANVQAMRLSFRGGTRQLRIEATASTNDLGAFRLHGLEPGRYYVSTSSGLAIEGKARTFYPHTTESAAASPISVAAGEESDGIDIWATSARGVQLAGWVLNPGVAGSGGEVVVTLIPRDSSGLAFSSGNMTGVDSEGHFVLPSISPGSYFLWVNCFQGHEQYYAGETIEVANSDIRDLRLTVSKAIDLVGNLRIEGMPEQPNSHLDIALESENGIASSLGTNVKPDGSFTITNIPPFRYTLSVLGMGDSLYIKSLDVMGQSLPDLTLDAARVGRGPITVVLSALGGTTRGRVVDDNKLPAIEARVVLVPELSRRSQTQLYKTTTTDSNSQFRLAGISPGKYELFACRHLDDDAYLDPEFLRQVEEFGQEITVVESGHDESSNEDIVLTVIPSRVEELR